VTGPSAFCPHCAKPLYLTEAGACANCGGPVGAAGPATQSPGPWTPLNQPPAQGQWTQGPWTPGEWAQGPVRERNSAAILGIVLALFVLFFVVPIVALIFLSGQIETILSTIGSGLDPTNHP
jgi:hypothetical protein